MCGSSGHGGNLRNNRKPREAAEPGGLSLWITVDAGHPVDFLDMPPVVAVHPVTSSSPVVSYLADIIGTDQVFDFAEIAGILCGLTGPAGLCPADGCSDGQEIDLPFCVEAPPAFPPLQVPDPDLRKHHYCEGQRFGVDAKPLHLALG